MDDITRLGVGVAVLLCATELFGHMRDLFRSLSNRQLMRPRDPATGPAPPGIGQLLICLFVPLERQKDRLGDFEEMFNSVWVPRFGVPLAKCVYVAQALRSAVAVVGIGLIAAVADRVWRVLSR